jgi:hypothetical protein
MTLEEAEQISHHSVNYMNGLIQRERDRTNTNAVRVEVGLIIIDIDHPYIESMSIVAKELGGTIEIEPIPNDRRSTLYFVI